MNRIWIKKYFPNSKMNGQIHLVNDPTHLSEFEPFNLNSVNFFWFRFGTVALVSTWNHSREGGKGKNYFPFLFVFF